MELETVEKVPIEQIRLDRRSLWLIGGAEDAFDEATLARLYQSAAFGELLQSIFANGYLDIETLIAMSATNSDALVVLEGNRRLAALRVLRKPNPVDHTAGQAEMIGAHKFYNSILAN